MSFARFITSVLALSGSCSLSQDASGPEPEIMDGSAREPDEEDDEPIRNEMMDARAGLDAREASVDRDAASLDAR